MLSKTVALNTGCDATGSKTVTDDTINSIAARAVPDWRSRATRIQTNSIISQRDAVYKRGLCRRAVSVCPAGCPSVRHVGVLSQNV